MLPPPSNSKTNNSIKTRQKALDSSQYTGTFESISAIFPLRAILGSPEAIKGQSSTDVIIFFSENVPWRQEL